MEGLKILRSPVRSRLGSSPPSTTGRSSALRSRNGTNPLLLTWPHPDRRIPIPFQSRHCGAATAALARRARPIPSRSPMPRRRPATPRSSSPRRRARATAKFLSQHALVRFHPLPSTGREAGAVVLAKEARKRISPARPSGAWTAVRRRGRLGVRGIVSARPWNCTTRQGQIRCRQLHGGYSCQ